ncbi:uncharacterized protein B0T23DRAFT_405309 [Neurospora hispaniola]|uniref:Uncharacterized protein n=1 Tax=Neurospora hispaniola TaxID=588809 RepID=A0AAJ0I5K9_9PEZI|nr:hypothetical protein B0T23DRAFT_405309 [Neurospora hispaniola]
MVYMDGCPDKAGEVCRAMKVDKNSVPNGTKAWKGVDAGIWTDQRVMLTSTNQTMISYQVETEVPKLDQNPQTLNTCSQFAQMRRRNKIEWCRYSPPSAGVMIHHTSPTTPSKIPKIPQQEPRILQ